MLYSNPNLHDAVYFRHNNTDDGSDIDQILAHNIREIPSYLTMVLIHLFSNADPHPGFNAVVHVLGTCDTHIMCHRKDIFAARWCLLLVFLHQVMLVVNPHRLSVTHGVHKRVN